MKEVISRLDNLNQVELKELRSKIQYNLVTILATAAVAVTLIRRAYQKVRPVLSFVLSILAILVGGLALAIAPKANRPKYGQEVGLHITVNGDNGMDLNPDQLSETRDSVEAMVSRALGNV